MSKNPHMPAKGNTGLPRAMTRAHLKEFRRRFDVTPKSESGLAYRHGGRWGKGARAGSKADGYWRVHVGGDRFHAHRIIMAMTRGRPLRPDELVDHINHDPMDNRVVNLRLATRSANALHKRPQQPSGGSTYRGVDRSTDRVWKARVTFQGRRWRCGRYSDPREACQARNLVVLHLDGDYGRVQQDVNPIFPSGLVRRQATEALEAIVARSGAELAPILEGDPPGARALGLA